MTMQSGSHAPGPPFQGLPGPVAGETARLINFQLLYVLLAAALGTVASIGLSFGGTVYNLERDGGAMFSTIGSALSVSVVTGVFQLIGWWVLLDTRHYCTAWRKIGGLVCAVVFLLFGYGTSSYFNYTMLSAPSATVIYLSDQVRERTAILDALRVRADAINQLLPAVRAERDSACDAKDLEDAEGAYSGSPGRGFVYAVFADICKRASVAAEALEGALAVNVDNARRARAVLEALETGLSDVSAPILERERALRRLIRDLDDILRDVRGARMTESTDTFFAVLSSSVAALGSGDGLSLEARQNRALANLRAGMEERLPVIRKMIADVSQADVPAASLDTRPSVHELMLHSVGKHPQNVLLAAGIDSFAAFMILVLLLKQPRAPRLTPHRV